MAGNNSAFHVVLPCGRIISSEQYWIASLPASKYNVDICHIISSMQHKHTLQRRRKIAPLSIPIIGHPDMHGHGYGMIFNWGISFFFLTKDLIERKQ